MSTFIDLFSFLLSNGLKFTQRGCVSQCGLQITVWNFIVSQLPDVQAKLGEQPGRKLCLPVQDCREQKRTQAHNLSQSWNFQKG